MNNNSRLFTALLLLLAGGSATVQAQVQRSDIVQAVKLLENNAQE